MQGPICGGSCQMRDSYCRVKNGELYIYNLLISKHKTTGKYFNHEEKRCAVALLGRLGGGGCGV